jgi:hypothetical protein
VAAVVIYVDVARSPESKSRYVIDRSSLAAVGVGRAIGTSWGATVYAVVVLHDGNMGGDIDTTGRVASATPLAGVNEIKQELGKAGADRIVLAISDVPPAPLWAALGVPWSGVLDHLRPRLVLFGAEAPSTAELAPRTGARIGARLLHRARAANGDDLELRDRDGGRVRSSDSGASVCSVVAGPPIAHAQELVPEITVLGLPGGDKRVEVAGAQPAEVVAGASTLIILGDDALDPGVIAGAQRLAQLIGAHVIGSPNAARAGAIALDHVVDTGAPLAPELAVIVGNLAIDLAGSTTIVRVGVDVSGKGLDGLLPPPMTNSLDELVNALSAGGAA